LNKTIDDIPVELRLEDINGEIRLVTHQQLEVPSESFAEATFFIVLNEQDIRSMKMDISVGVFLDGERIETVKTTFFGPAIN
jgi:hypothetical protein